MAGTTKVEDVARAPRPMHAAAVPDEGGQRSLLHRIGPVLLIAIGVGVFASTVVLVTRAAGVYVQARADPASAEASVGREATELDGRAGDLDQRISILRLSADAATRRAEAQEIAEAEICDPNAADFDSALADLVVRAERRFPGLAGTSWVQGLDQQALRARRMACWEDP